MVGLGGVGLRQGLADRQRPAVRVEGGVEPAGPALDVAEVPEGLGQVGLDLRHVGLVAGQRLLDLAGVLEDGQGVAAADDLVGDQADAEDGLPSSPRTVGSSARSRRNRRSSGGPPPAAPCAAAGGRHVEQLALADRS